MSAPTARKTVMTLHYSASEMSGFPRNLVSATVARHDGRDCLRVAPLLGLQQDQLIDKPSFVILPTGFANGTIEVEVLARLLPDAPDFARAFVGLACRITPDLSRFEAVYLRPLNGRSLNPPAPRHLRAVQYFAFPAWDYQTLRDAYPDGRYEAGADIGPDQWISLRLDVDGPQVSASVNGTPVLKVNGKGPVQSGQVGLWVDIGTEAFFADLRITPRDRG